jgi:hypothetical protein
MSNLSAYALACGYVQRVEIGDYRVSLYREHGVYHVRAYNFEQSKRIAWDVFHTLGEARKAFRALIPS